VAILVYIVSIKNIFIDGGDPLNWVNPKLMILFSKSLSTSEHLDARKTLGTAVPLVLTRTEHPLGLSTKACRNSHSA
jgi:hypothetical protein